MEKEKIFNLGGTMRSNSAEQTLERVKPLLKVFGITRVAAQEVLSEISIPVSVCYRPNSKSLATSQGKGITRQLADVSAIMESIELFHAENLPDPDYTSSVLELKQSKKLFLDPSNLVFSDDCFYREDERLGWMSSKRILDGEIILVPRFYLDLDTSKPRLESAAHAFQVSSNGLASGNTLNEAVIHGLYELIERHSVMEILAQGPEILQKRRLNLESIQGAPHVESLMHQLLQGDIEIEVTDYHGTLGIPTFGVKILATYPVGQVRSLCAGFGAHFVAEVALSRALTEAYQSYVTLITGARDDIYDESYVQYDSAVAEYLPKSKIEAGTLLWNQIPRLPSFSSFSEVLSWTVQHLDTHGFSNSCFYSHQKLEYGDIPVVTVIVPGFLFSRDEFHPSSKRRR